MPDPTEPAAPAIDAQRLNEMRLKAASRLAGAASTQGAAKGATDRAVDALSVLHALASSPATAPDALALLHELQVHQVELDMQAQELQDSRAELESALQRHAERYDALPVGCFGLDAGGTVLELNQTGAALLGLPRDEAPGLLLGGFLGADDAQRLLQALAGLASGGPPPVLRLALAARDRGPRTVLARIAADPSAAGRFLLGLTDLGDGGAVQG